jgi:phosphoglycerate dehydrogenase-like enzyme
LRFPKVVVATPPTDSKDGNVTVTTAIVPDDSVPADSSKAVAEITAVRDANHTSYGENTVAEHTFALMLALSRQIPETYARVRRPKL